MKIMRLSTQLHKWITLVVGVQVLFWVGGGLVMTVIPIERVRGEHHARDITPQPLTPAELAILPTLADGQPLAKAELKSTPRGPVWVLTPVEGEPRVVSARNGRAMPAMTPAQASRAAATAYQGSGRPVSTRYLTQAPEETGREGPLWRIDFDDREHTSFYLSPETGEVVSKRSGLWRFYDLFWRLHAMDWNDGEDFNHPLIVITTLLTLSIVITGFILLFVRLGRDWKALKARRGGHKP